MDNSFLIFDNFYNNVDQVREEALKQQALLLKAAESSMNEKLKHFDLLKQDLLKMLDKLKEKDEKQLEDLVKVYSVMKPKLAANILNLMDLICP